MSIPTSVVFIFVPMGIGVLLLVFTGLRRLLLGVGIALCAVLAWTAWTLGVEQVVTLNEGLVFKLVANFDVLGRQFVITDGMRPFLTAIWVVMMLWLVGGIFTETDSRFIPLGLIFVSFLIAALAVRPFLYAALLIELAVLVSIPILIPPGQGAGRGMLRYIAYHTIGMPFILFTGWMLAGVEASPGQLDLVVRAGLLIGIGFAFLLSVVPFHTWIPLVFDETQPYVAAFVVTLLTGFISVFALTFLDRFVWLRNADRVYVLLRSFGAVMTLVGAGWIVFERRLGRMLGHALVLETGMFLLAVGLGAGQGVQLYFALALPRVVSVLVWAASLEQLGLRTEEKLTLDSIQGIANQQPLVTFTLLLAVFSLSGLPGLSGFPARQLLWQGLAVQYPWSAAAALLGSAGLIGAGLRLMRSLVLSAPAGSLVTEQVLAETILPGSLADISMTDVLVWAFTGLAALMSVVVGFFPHWFLPFIARIPEMFSQLGR